MIKGDSTEYHLITKEIGKLELNQVTLTCEIGLREGLGSKIIMDAILDSKPKLYKHVAVDPYNNLSYEHYDNEGSVVAGYTEEMKQKTVSYLYQNYPDFDFFHMTDDYYFKTMGGPHTTKAVIDELGFFIPRMASKGLIILDDYTDLQMGIVDMLLKTYNFNVVEKGDNKIIYQKEI